MWRENETTATSKAEKLVNERESKLNADIEWYETLLDTTHNIISVIGKFDGKVFNNGLVKKINLALKENDTESEFGITTTSQYRSSTDITPVRAHVFIGKRFEYNGEDHYTSLNFAMPFAFVFLFNGGRIDAAKTVESLNAYAKYLEDNIELKKLELTSLIDIRYVLEKFFNVLEELNNTPGTSELDIKENLGVIGKAYPMPNSEYYYKIYSKY